MELSPDGAGHRREVFILANPVAGPRGRRQHVRAFAYALRDRGLEPILCGQREELSERLSAGADRARCVVAAGGDGTLNEVLNRASGLPVAILPLGNENLAARYFRLARSATRLADAIAFAPIRRLDLGRAHGRLFSLMAGLGLDAEVVHAVHRSRRGHIDKLSYVLPVLQALATYPFPTVEVTIEDTGEQLRGATVFLFNLPVYALGLPIADKARPDDGLLDLFVFQRPGLRNLARYFGAILCRRHEQLPDVQHRRVKRVHLAAGQPAPLQVDGDPAAALPATIEVAPGAWQLLAPT